jgi:DKNYY family
MSFVKNSIILYLIFFALILSCNKFNKSSTTQVKSVCKNDISLYSPIKGTILYKDATGKIYLRVKNNILDNPTITLSECQKLPFGFVNDVALIDDTITTLEDVVDIESFSRISGTSHYYLDKNRVFYYRTAPVTYPNFYEIEINKTEFRIIDSITISDKSKVYVNGILKI